MFQEKQYRGKHSKYPTIHSDINEDQKLAIFTCTWGNQDATNRVVSTIKDYYLSARMDDEFTPPFPLQKDLSLAANHLRISVMLANDNLYNEFNKEELMALTEILVIAVKDRELNVIQCGGPNLLCKKHHSGISTYVNSHHLGHEFDASKKYPLPSNFIGGEVKKTVHYHRFRYDKKDTYYLLMSDRMSVITENEDLKSIESKIQLDKECPYWLAELRF